MGQMRYIVTAPGKEPVEFFVPDGADDAQLRQLASRALASTFPRETFVTPILDAAARKTLERAPRKLTQDEILSQQGGLSAPEPTLANAAVDRIRETMTGWGMDPYIAQREAENIASGLQFLPGPGTATAADDARIAAEEGRYGAAGGNALAAGLDILPGVGKGASALAMFLGRSAKTANLDFLRKAEQMAEQGADKRQIWDETGWFKGADNQWRFEISDEKLKVKDPKAGAQVARAAGKAKLKELGYKDWTDVPAGSDDWRAVQASINDAWEANEGGQPLSDVLSHPELEAAGYPNIERMTAAPLTAGQGNGRYLPVQNQIQWKKSGRTAEDKRSTVAHELQHGIQNYEGFSGGAQVGSAGSYEGGAHYTSAVGHRDHIQKLLDDPNVSDISKIQLRRMLPKAEEEIARAAQYEGYRRVAGEVEARNVQRRLTMTPEERAATPPWETQDIPDEEQFNVWGGNIASDAPLSADPAGTVPTASALEAFAPVKTPSPSKGAMATAKKLSTMAGSPAGGGKKLSTRQIKGLSEDYLRQLEQGAAGADWYQQSGRSIMEHMGENEPLAVKLTGAIGVTSSQTPVLTNLEHGVRGHNQAMMGDPVRTGMFPTAMGKDIEGIYAAPDMSLGQLRNLDDPSQFGMKRTPFIQQNLMYEGFEPGQASTARAVHDIWDMRARLPGPGRDAVQHLGLAGTAQVGRSPGPGLPATRGELPHHRRSRRLGHRTSPGRGVGRQQDRRADEGGQIVRRGAEGRHHRL